MEEKQKTQFSQCKLYKLTKSLPNEGIITFDPNTSFWYIKLNAWQNQCQNIATLAYNILKDTNQHLKSIELCKSWSLLINNSHPKISCVTPPSISGLHISLDHRANDENKPKQLIEGKKVSFRMKNIKLFPTIRQFPCNINGQFTSSDGLRYYPTLWVLVEIEFCDFVYNTQYTPHISLACIAVQLSVNEVHKLYNTKIIKMDKRKSNELHHSIVNSDVSNIQNTQFSIQSDKNKPDIFQYVNANNTCQQKDEDSKKRTFENEKEEQVTKEL